MNEHIAKLKKFKAPWWSRVLGNLRARKAARRARHHVRHVATITLWCRNVNNTNSYPSWLMLFERGDGKRTYKFKRGMVSLPIDQLRDYYDVVLPWVDHKYSNKQMLELQSASRKMPHD